MYLGNQPLSASYLTDYFSGNNTTVAFTLSRAPVSASAVIITISGVKQAASTYGVSGTTLTFSGAPPSGTNNIEVLHLGVQPDTVVQPSYRTITEFTATAGQTTFSPASYTAGYIDVFRNGVKLGSADFTATNGTTVVLANACTLGDYVRFEGFLITTFNNAIPNTNGAVGDSLIASVSASKLTGSRTIPAATMPAGTVLQVVTGTNSSTVTTSSTSYVTTNLSATITPLFSSSTILVMTSANMRITNGTWFGLRTYRNGSFEYQYSSGLNYNNTTGAGSVFSWPCFYTFISAPSSTAAQTYSLWMSNSTGGANTTVFNPDVSPMYITLMEIAV